MIQICGNAKLPDFGLCEHTVRVVKLNTGRWMKVTTTGTKIFLHLWTVAVGKRSNSGVLDTGKLSVTTCDLVWNAQRTRTIVCFPIRQSSFGSLILTSTPSCRTRKKPREFENNIRPYCLRCQRPPFHYKRCKLHSRPHTFSCLRMESADKQCQTIFSGSQATMF
jgi:hypothetical protein